MKISESQAPAANKSQAAGNEADSRRNSDESGKSNFSKVLSKKRDAREADGQAQNGKSTAGEQDPSMFGMAQLQAPFDQNLRPAAVEGARPVTVPAELQQLVNEISVVVQSPNDQQVHIELNSNVLKGLMIDIRRHDGAVAIQFHSTSDQVANLLSTHIDVLSQSLEDRGVNVSNIRVSKSRESGASHDFKGRPGSGARGGRGGGR